MSNLREKIWVKIETKVAIGKCSGENQKEKYFSVILNFTLDTIHEEQMTLIQCINMSNNKIKIEEYFLEFLKVDDISGLGLLMSYKMCWSILILMLMMWGVKVMIMVLIWQESNKELKNGFLK